MCLMISHAAIPFGRLICGLYRHIQFIFTQAKFIVTTTTTTTTTTNTTTTTTTTTTNTTSTSTSGHSNRAV
jgi:hypothetical protein